MDQGNDIPLEQILAGPRRGHLAFEESKGDRSIGQMVAGKELGLPPEVKATGWKPGKKKGWLGLTKGQYVAYQSSASRRLSVAHVLYNDKSSMSVEAQSCRSTWDGIAVKHLKEYRRNDSEGSEVTLEPTEELVKLTILYRTLVKVVELYVDGRMFQGDASALAKGGWSFKLSEEEAVRAIAGAMILDHQLRKTPKILSLIHI